MRPFCKGPRRKNCTWLRFPQGDATAVDCMMEKRYARSVGRAPGHRRPHFAKAFGEGDLSSFQESPLPSLTTY
jgi:hypothetical protein